MCVWGEGVHCLLTLPHDPGSAACTLMPAAQFCCPACACRPQKLSWPLQALHACACVLPGAGEMSATVVREPQSWTKAVSRIKADIVAGRDDASELMPNLKVGVSTNFNKLVSPAEPLSTRPGAPTGDRPEDVTGRQAAQLTFVPLQPHLLHGLVTPVCLLLPPLCSVPVC